MVAVGDPAGVEQLPGSYAVADGQETVLGLFPLGGHGSGQVVQGADAGTRCGDRVQVAVLTRCGESAVCLPPLGAAVIELAAEVEDSLSQPCPFGFEVGNELVSFRRVDLLGRGDGQAPRVPLERSGAAVGRGGVGDDGERRRPGLRGDARRFLLGRGHHGLSFSPVLLGSFAFPCCLAGRLFGRRCQVGGDSLGLFSVCLGRGRDSLLGAGAGHSFSFVEIGPKMGHKVGTWDSGHVRPA